MVYISKEYLTEDSILQCEFGSNLNIIKVNPKTIQIQEFQIANQDDNIAGKNILGFGSCAFGHTCKLETDFNGMPLEWFEFNNTVQFGDSQSLCEDSYCFCLLGKKISVFQVNQIDFGNIFEELKIYFGFTDEQVQDMAQNIEIAKQTLITGLTQIFENFIQQKKDEKEKIPPNNNIGMIDDYFKVYVPNNVAYAHMANRNMNLYKKVSIEEYEKIQKLRKQYTDEELDKMFKKELFDNNKTKKLVEKYSFKELIGLGTNEKAINKYTKQFIYGTIPISLPIVWGKNWYQKVLKPGTEKENIEGYWNKAIDHKNKKMMHGVFGGDVLKAAQTETHTYWDDKQKKLIYNPNVTSAFTYFSPEEEFKILENMTDGEKAAYALHTSKNKGLDDYKSFVYLVMIVDAGNKATKGKVTTGEKEKIPQGFTEKEFKEFSKATKKLIQKQKLPEGETYAHGSRVEGTARPNSDIDVIHRVSESDYNRFVNNRINSVHSGSALQKKLIKEAAKGKFSRYQISQTFNKDFYDILVPNSPIKDIDFSIIIEGSHFDTGPFIEIK